MGDELWSGWGVRTMATGDGGYNPLTYHNGTVWPHDNSLIALGLARYGFRSEALRIVRSLMAAAGALDYQLPEVFGGFQRSEAPQPIAYPTATKPQAWAAGSMLHLMQAVLGLAPDAPNHRLNVVRPKLPYWLNRVHVRGLRVGPGRVDLNFTREHGTTHVAVDHAEGVEVVRRRTWPTDAAIPGHGR